MAITSINTNVPSQNAAANVRGALDDVKANAARLSSGNRIVKASDDAAGLSIGTGLKADVTTLRANLTSASQAKSILSIADGALDNAADILQRMKSLASQANAGTMTATEHGFIQQELTALDLELTRISAQTTFNGQALLDGTFSAKDFQVGYGAADVISVTLGDVSAATLGVNTATIPVTDQTTAAAAVTAISTAIGTVNAARATVGASQSRFDFAANNIETSIQNVDSARADYLDADTADTAAAFGGSQVKMQAGISVLAQTNQLTANLLKLLG